MNLKRVLYVQTFRADTAERQAELDKALARNLISREIDSMVIFKEEGSIIPPCNNGASQEVIKTDRRLTYADWLRHLQRQINTIGLLANADIELVSGFGDKLNDVLMTPDSAIALTRHNYKDGGNGMTLNRFPQWTQDLWAMRSDAEITESLLAASAIPLGMPGCDNRFAHVLWSHGFMVKNPCHWLITLHHHGQQKRAYDKSSDRAYGSACYVYPSLCLADESELQHVAWSKSKQSVVGTLVNHTRGTLAPKQLQSSLALESSAFADQLKDAAMAAEYQIYDDQQGNQKTWRLTAGDLVAHGLFYTPAQGGALSALQVRSGSVVLNNFRMKVRSIPDNVERFIAMVKGKRQFISLAEGAVPVTAVSIQMLPQSANTIITSRLDSELVEFTAYAHTHEPCKKEDEIKPEKGQGVGNSFTSLRFSPPKHVSIVELDLSKWEKIYNYNERFSIWRRDEQIVGMDKFWPTALIYNKAQNQPDAIETEAREMFLWAFSWPVLEWRPGHISAQKRYPGDNMFWQHPCRTEQDGYESHCRIAMPCIQHNTAHIYLALPWATWIDRKHYPQNLLNSIRRRLQAVSNVLGSWGISLRAHTICQHIKWREWQPIFLETGVSDLWVSHKKLGEVSDYGIGLESWPLYAVNILEPQRRAGLRSIPINERPILASFRGAYMPHYISKIRQQLSDLGQLSDFVIEVNDEWHFNPIVYGHQVMGRALPDEAQQMSMIIDYNRLLVNSVFSLCPSGAGPNTLRLWESLGAGAIPVVLSDTFEPPMIMMREGGEVDWENAVIFHQEDQWESLPQRLADVSTEERLWRQRNCFRLFERSRLKTCFGAAGNNRL